MGLSRRTSSLGIAARTYKRKKETKTMPMHRTPTGCIHRDQEPNPIAKDSFFRESPEVWRSPSRRKGLPLAGRISQDWPADDRGPPGAGGGELGRGSLPPFLPLASGEWLRLDSDAWRSRVARQRSESESERREGRGAARVPLGPAACLPTPASAPCSAWWSSSSWRPAWKGSGCLRLPQNFSNTVCRTLAKMLCLLEFLPEATRFGSPGPAHCSEGKVIGKFSSSMSRISSAFLFSMDLFSVSFLLCGQNCIF